MKTRELTTAQKEALIIAGQFLLSGEWDETITATQKTSLESGVRKLQESIALSTGSPHAKPRPRK